MTADVHILAGDTATIVDLTTAAAVQRLRVASGGDTPALAPVGSSTPELVPVSVAQRATMSAWTGTTVDRLALIAAEKTPALAVILADSDTGWIIGGRIVDSGLDAPTQSRNDGVQSVDLTVATTAARPLVIRDVLEITTNTALTVPALTTGSVVWLALTTAGTVAGTARTTGVYATTITAGSAAVANARGWLLVAAPASVGA